MDPSAADPSCIIQALPANSPSSTTLPPPLVQALPALSSPSPPNDHAPPAAASSSRPPKRRPRLPTPPPPGPAPPSPRRTRSGGAPEWTPAETLALVAGVAAVDDGWSRSVSAFQKWAMVAENLAASEAFASGSARRGGRGSKRGAGECRRRWEALAAEYGAVRRWEVRTGGRYWEMSAAARRKAGLPAEFDAEVYGVMDALIRVEEEALIADAAGTAGAGEEVEDLVEVGEEDTRKLEVGEDGVKEEDESADEGEDEDPREEEEEMQADAGNAEDDGEGEEEMQADADNDNADDSVQEHEEMQVDAGNADADGEDEEEMQADADNADASNNFEGCEADTNNKTEASKNIAWELANKLQENAQHIQTIVNEEAGEYAANNHAHAYSTSPDALETTRKKADELIKSLSGLLGYLNQFTELIKETGLENVGMT